MTISAGNDFSSWPFTYEVGGLGPGSNEIAIPESEPYRYWRINPRTPWPSDWEGSWRANTMGGYGWYGTLTPTNTATHTRTYTRTPTRTFTNTPTHTHTNTPIPTVTCVSSGWCTSISPNVGIGANVLRGLAVIAYDNIWAVGEQNGASLIEHWDGQTWNIVTPIPNIGVLNGISALSNDDIWVAGNGGIIHRTNAGWGTPIPGRSGGKAIAARQTAGDYHVWAVGGIIQHLEGTVWSERTLGNNSLLNGVATSGAGTWAVGFTVEGSTRRKLFMRVDKDELEIIADPDPDVDLGESYFTSIDIYDANTIWVVGTALPRGASYYQTLVEHYDSVLNRRTVVSSPNPGSLDNILNRVWINGEGDVWAVGSKSNTSTYINNSLILHWNDTFWDTVQSPSPGVSSELFGVATIPGSRSVLTSTWAVGGYTPGVNRASNTLVEHIDALPAPRNTRSYYINNIKPDEDFARGCQAAARGESGLVILDYGKPMN